ncbi:hypothetical protein LSTR_LSTR006991 [Laodelphax striatellus]|uniref:Uncharacterized protein n=1 Tax=Laodelphax striatellus TaxID=195883 RepID=A0A482WJE0_LAOST|nr:hypothetical protein LSTR_LSTR006991 [Laodelphax striatellus]
MLIGRTALSRAVGMGPEELELDGELPEVASSKDGQHIPVCKSMTKPDESAEGEEAFKQTATSRMTCGRVPHVNAELMTGGIAQLYWIGQQTWAGKSCYKVNLTRSMWHAKRLRHPYKHKPLSRNEEALIEALVASQEESPGLQQPSGIGIMLVGGQIERAYVTSVFHFLPPSVCYISKIKY